MGLLKLVPIFSLALLAFPDMVPAQINYFGAAFSPYVKYRNPDGQYPYWNSYSVNDIKQMLNIALGQHNAIATYSMGVSTWNKDSPWDQADSNALVARSAAQINRERGNVVLSVSVGVYQQDDQTLQDKEVQNAFSAIQDANGIFGGTVWGLTLTNEYVTDTNNGQKVLNMIRNNKARAHGMGIKIGTRIHTCGQIYSGQVQGILTQIVQEADFIMCNIYPGSGQTNVNAAVQQVNDQYFSARDGMWRVNPNLEVLIGETGWPSEGRSFNNDASANNVANLVAFWNGIKTWSRNNQVKVHMFEAFDEPWKADSEFQGEGHYGWWYRKNNNEAVYIEKATGKQFQ